MQNEGETLGIGMGVYDPRGRFHIQWIITNTNHNPN